MRINQKVTGKAMSVGGGVAVGVLCSVILTIVGSLLLSALINGELVREENLGYGSIVILLLASAVGSVVAWRCIRYRKLMVCLLSGIGYYMALLGTTALLFGGQYQGMGVTALVVLAGCGCVAILGLKRDKSIKNSYKKILPR